MTQSNMVATDIERFLDVLSLSGEVHELRVPKYNTYGNTASGYFENPKTMASAVAEWDSQANLYLTLNPVNPALLARANNRIIDKSTNTTSDADITRRNWLFLDIDADRPAGISSTEVELGTARATLDNSVARSRTLAYLAQVALKALETGELESRVAMQEAAVRSKHRWIDFIIDGDTDLVQFPSEGAVS